MSDDEDATQDVFARRAAITADFMNTEVDTATMYANEYPAPIELKVLEDNFPSRRFLPLEAVNDKSRDVTRVLVLTGSDPAETLQCMVKLSLEPYEDAMSARGGTEKQMVQGLHRFVRDHAADEWHGVLDEANLSELENDAGEYPKGTYNNLTVEWLGKMCQNPALRDSYISWLEAGKSKKGADISANLYLVLFKVGMRIMKRTGGTKKWPSVTDFIVWFYRGFPVTYKDQFRAVHPSGTKVTVRTIMSYMNNLESAEKSAKRRYDGREVAPRTKPPESKKARRSGRGPRHGGYQSRGGSQSRDSSGRGAPSRGGGRYVKRSGRGRGQGQGQRRQYDKRQRDGGRYRGDHQQKGHDEVRRSRGDRDEDVHLAEAEHQEDEGADEVSAAMESEEPASSFQDSSESVPSAEDEDCLDDQYCADAVGKTSERMDSLVLEDTIQNDLFETTLVEGSTLHAEEAAYLASLGPDETGVSKKTDADM